LTLPGRHFGRFGPNQREVTVLRESQGHSSSANPRAGGLHAKKWREAITALERAISLDPTAGLRLSAPLATANNEIAWAAFLDVELRGKPVEGLENVLSNTEKAVARAIIRMFTTRAGISI
jgi:hypothetical protein